VWAGMPKRTQRVIVPIEVLSHKVANVVQLMMIFCNSLELEAIEAGDQEKASFVKDVESSVFDLEDHLIQAGVLADRPLRSSADQD